MVKMQTLKPGQFIDDVNHQMIDLKDWRDLEMMKNLYNAVRAYRILNDQDQRKQYLETIRLRSVASQYMNSTAAVKDGWIYPFLLFSVQENP